jgi:flagellar hook-associated protein 2
MGSVAVNLSPGAATSGSGIDVTSVVNQILASESAPENQLKQNLTDLASAQVTLSGFNSGLFGLLTSVNALSDIGGALTARTAVSSRTDLLSATADSSAAAGRHTIVIANLATGSSYATGPQTSSTTPLTPGSFNLQLGSATAVLITVDNTNNTLSGLASSINAQNLGVTASVVTDASGARLSLLSNSTGLTNDLKITNDTTGLAFTKTATAANASLTVDGLGISSATNTVSGVLGGVTLNLTGASPGTPISLNVAPDTSRATQAIQDFVNAYNSLIAQVNQQFAYDPTLGRAGALSGNGDVRALQTQLLGETTYSISGNNGITGLASIGVNLGNDGTLSVDNAKLSDTLTNHYQDLQTFFQAASGQTGFAQKLSKDLRNLTDSTRGLLNVALTQNRNDRSAIQSSINTFEDRLAVRRQQLTIQYSQVDAILRNFPLLQAQITGELASLPTVTSVK